jgi:hypothetical protein
MKTFNCPVYKRFQLATIDKASGNYFTYCYLPGRSLPGFGAGDPYPTRIDTERAPWVMMQDVLFSNPTGANCQYNHGPSVMPWDYTSSNSAYRTIWANGMSSKCGAHSLLNDGSVHYRHVSEMTLTYGIGGAPTNAMVMMRAP